MSKDWVIIYTTNLLFQAELAKQMLADNGIQAFIINKKDSNYHFGDIEVYVQPDDVIKSKMLINKFEN